MDEKYLTLLDDETRDFISHTEAFYPADAIDASVDKQREYYDALCRAYDTEYPEGVTASDSMFVTREASIPYREYASENQTDKAHVVYYHGGGFIVGGLESHDGICAEICGRTGLGLTAVDYRLVPEHLHPAAIDDALIAFQRIANEKAVPVIVVGDSAGGNLAAAVSHLSRENRNAPAGQVLIYPGLGGDMTCGSYVEHANAPMLTTADVHYYHGMRMPEGHAGEDASANPLSDPDFSNLPPTVIVTAECDPLADDGRDYRDRLHAAGVRAVWFNEKGMVHGYLRARYSVERAADSFTRIIDSICMLADRGWEYD